MFAMTGFEIWICVVIALAILGWMMKLFAKGFVQGLGIGFRLFMGGR